MSEGGGRSRAAVTDEAVTDPVKTDQDDPSEQEFHQSSMSAKNLQQQQQQQQQKYPQLLENGYVRYELHLTFFDLKANYVDPTYVGRGAYGSVCKAKNVDTGQELAIKKLSGPFYDTSTACKTYRELRLLQILEHDNVIDLLDVYTPDLDYADLNNIYLVTAHAGWDLHEVMSGTELTDLHYRLITYQLLCGLKYLHSAGIVHRDLKPGNVCLNSDAELRILDFGLARKVTSEIMTEYIVTRHYRAPELVCWSGPYHPKGYYFSNGKLKNTNKGSILVYHHKQADMWSVGCILAELLRKGRVLFPGESSADQFRLITEVCGRPDTEFLDKVESRASSDTRKFIEQSYTQHDRQDFAELFDGAHPESIDFLEKVLVLDPDKRMGVDNALRHSYVQMYRNEENEPIVSQSLELDDNCGSEHEDLAAWRKKIWKEIKSFVAREYEGNGENGEASSSASSSTNQLNGKSSPNVPPSASPSAPKTDGNNGSRLVSRSMGADSGIGTSLISTEDPLLLSTPSPSSTAAVLGQQSSFTP